MSGGNKNGFGPAMSMTANPWSGAQSYLSQMMAQPPNHPWTWNQKQQPIMPQGTTPLENPPVQQPPLPGASFGLLNQQQMPGWQAQFNPPVPPPGPPPGATATAAAPPATSQGPYGNDWADLMASLNYGSSGP